MNQSRAASRKGRVGTTILLARTAISAASQLDTVTQGDNPLILYSFAGLLIVICVAGGGFLLKGAFYNFNHIPANNTAEGANSIPLRYLNTSREQGVTNINRPDNALPNPNWGWNDNPINQQILDSYNHNRRESVDITDDILSSYENHTVQHPTRGGEDTRDIIRPDSPTLPNNETMDLTEILNHIV